MIGFRYRVQLDRETPQVVDTTAKAVVQFEQSFGMSVAVLATDPPMLTYHYTMAWLCGWQDRMKWLDWLDRLVDFEVITDGDDTADHRGS